MIKEPDKPSIRELVVDQDNNANSYHEKLRTDGFEFNSCFPCYSTISFSIPPRFLDGLEKVVVVPGSLVPEIKPKDISEDDFNKVYYAVYTKPR